MVSVFSNNIHIGHFMPDNEDYVFDSDGNVIDDDCSEKRKKVEVLDFAYENLLIYLNKKKHLII